MCQALYLVLVMMHLVSNVRQGPCSLPEAHILVRETTIN